MKDHQLKALLQVAESGSIRAASRAMNLSQSALTRALRELEEDVGAELLSRSYKGAEFTAAGETLLSRARLARSILDKAQEEIQLLHGGVGVRVSIAVTPLVAVAALAKVLRDFERLHPAAEVSVGEGLLSTILPDLTDGRLDFAVALADPDNLPYDITFEPIAPVEPSLAGRCGHPLAHATNWDELREARWVLNLSAGSQGDSLIHWLQAQGTALPNNVIRCSSPVVMLEMMRRTDRICVGPSRLFDDPMFGNGIQRIPVGPLPPPMALGLITLRGVPLASAARQMANLFARHLRPPL